MAVLASGSIELQSVDYATEGELSEAASTAQAATSAVSERVDALGGRMDAVGEWLTVTDAGLDMGRDGSDVRMHLDSDSLDFVAGGRGIASLDGGTATLTAPRVRVGGYQWQASGDAIALVWVGGGD